MRRLPRLLRRIQWLLALQSLAAAVTTTAALALAALTLALLLERALGLDLPWGAAAALAAGSAVAAALLWTVVHAPSKAVAAMRADERMGLRDALSTAWALRDSDDPWARAVVQEAEALAQRTLARRAAPWRRPRAWFGPPLTGAAFALAWFAAPSLDLLGQEAQAQQEQRRQQELAQARDAVNRVEQELAQALAKLRMTDAIEGLEARATAQAKTPDDIRLSAVRTLSEAHRQLEALQRGEGAQALRAVQRALAQAAPRGAGPLQPLAQALRMGDLGRASEALDQLRRALADGALTPQQRQELAKQLQDMARNLAAARHAQRALEEALRRAGLDPALALDPQAALRALAAVKGLSPEQKQAIEQLARGAMRSQQALSRLAKAIHNAAAQLGADEALFAADAFAEMAQGLSEMEMLEAELAQAQAAAAQLWNKINELAGQCQGGKGDPFLLQQWRKYALGSRGGKGAGSAWGFGPEGQPLDPAATTARATRAKSTTSAGPIIGARLVQGDQVRGEARAELQQALAVSSQAAADAIENRRVPLEHQDAVKHYFGRLEAKVRADSDAADEQKAQRKDDR